MKKGEKGILYGLVLFVILGASLKAWQNSSSESTEGDKQIPFYSTADSRLASQASKLYRKYKCRDCHVIWGVRNIMQAVPAPSLDGIGSLRDEKWLAEYLAAPNPQSIIPSRLKPRFRMPSYADIPESDRALLVKYFSSLKVEDWYLPEARKAEYEKLTGKTYEP
jgi:sulfur-oxidizing protein SoxX